jgi:WD40 repeat protein
VNAIALSNDGTKLASGCSDGLVRVFNLETFEVELTFEGHKGKSLVPLIRIGEVMCVAFSPDDRLVLSGAMDYSLRVHNLEKKTTVKVFDQSFEGILNRIDLKY